jgi:NitT/TauT family transport system substrate-binding protein
MRRSLEASGDDEAMRAAIEANTETPPEVIPELALANWQADLDTEKLQLVGELAAEYGLLEDEPDLDALVWDGG